jgi:predicted amidohydrolase YtcJ
MKKCLIIVHFLLFFAAMAQSQNKMKADLILINGKVCTVDQRLSYAEAFAVRNGSFHAIGSNEQIQKHYVSDSVIDAGGMFVYPGFIDAHCHFYGYALGLREIDLRGILSFPEVVQLLDQERNKVHGEWIIGRGWDQNLWPGKSFPDRTELDILFPDRPVVLIRVDGHSVLANGEALRRAGIREENAFLPGEVGIQNGRLTGMLSENAADKMRSLIPEPSRKEELSLFGEAEQNCFAVGLTGLSDAGLDLPQITLLDSLQQEGLLKMRLYIMLNPTDENIRFFVNEGQVNTATLTIRSIKLYADGSLGSRTALLKEPYSDDATRYGIQVTPPSRIREICALALDKGYQVNTHAIGDSAVAEVLNIYSDFLKGKNDLRWRIEHAQVVEPGDFNQFSRNSIIPSVQATHATSDMNWAGSRLGSRRMRFAYAYKNLLDQNGWIANGTDFPIENISPLLTFYAAVARQDLSGKPDKGFQMENALSREEALRSITIWAARAGFQENFKGSIEFGKVADFVVIDKDLMNCPVKEIPSAKVIMTYLGGKKVYSKPLSGK